LTGFTTSIALKIEKAFYSLLTLSLCALASSKTSVWSSHGLWL